MHPLDTMAELITWAGKNIAYNLTFIPEDKLSWKPAPTAKSALEIAAEVGKFSERMVEFLQSGSWPEGPLGTYGSLEEAREGLLKATEAYATALRAVAPERMGETVQLPFGPFPFARAASLPALDAIHHHGQIAYIQTLLGDIESHFYEMNN